MDYHDYHIHWVGHGCFYDTSLPNRGASLRLFCYPGNRFLIRSVNRVTVHNSEICKKGPKQK